MTNNQLCTLEKEEKQNLKKKVKKEKKLKTEGGKQDPLPPTGSPDSVFTGSGFSRSSDAITMYESYLLLSGKLETKCSKLIKTGPPSRRADMK